MFRIKHFEFNRHLWDGGWIDIERQVNKHADGMEGNCNQAHIKVNVLPCSFAPCYSEGTGKHTQKGEWQKSWGMYNNNLG